MRRLAMSIRWSLLSKVPFLAYVLCYRMQSLVYDVEALCAECIEKNVSLKGLGSVLFIEPH